MYQYCQQIILSTNFIHVTVNNFEVTKFYSLEMYTSEVYTLRLQKNTQFTPTNIGPGPTDLNIQSVMVVQNIEKLE